MKKKILLLALSILCLAALLGGLFVANADETPETIIAGHNLSLDDSVQIIYYVKQTAPEGAEVGVLCWFDPQESYTLENAQYKLAQNGTRTISGTEYAQYNFPYVAAKMYTQDVYAVSYVKMSEEVIYGNLDKYSVLQYCQNKKNSGSALGNLVDQILDYGAAAQIYFNFNTDRLANADYYQISVEGGTLADGTTSGLYQVGEQVTLTAQIDDFCHWENSAGEVLGTATELTVTVTAGETYTASATHIEAIDPAVASCTAPGLTEGKHCSACGKVLVEQQQTPVVGHSFGEWIAEVPATQTQTGVYGHYHCSACGKDFDQDYHEITDLAIPVLESGYSQGLSYVSNGDGTCYVAGIGSCTDTDIIIPPTAPNGDTVTAIGNGQIVNGYFTGFDSCEEITSCIIPESVTTIANSAFADCTALCQLIVPNSVTSIADYAFYGCSNLASITFQGTQAEWENIAKGKNIGSQTIKWYSSGLNYTSNGDGTCYVSGIGNCKAIDVIIPPISPSGDVVTSIGDRAFYDCYSLTSVTIPDSVTSIGDYAFEYCRSLTSITIPDSVTSIGGSAFSRCTGLTSVTIGNSVTSIGYSAFYNCTGLKSVYITDLAAWCGISFGSSNTNPLCYAHNLYLNGTLVTDLVIPDSVTSIGNGAFYKCTGLTSVTIPDSVTSIGYEAFFDCTGLTSVYITDIAAWCGISFGGYDANPLYYAHNLYLNGTLVTDLVIPDSVTSIGEGAFRGCSSLTSVTIPNSVTGIGEGAFQNCTGLTSVTIPDSVTSIGDYAFQSCTSLTSVTIGNSVTSIGDSAFECCTSLTSVTIPDSVTSIGEWAFSSCSGLTSVTIPDGVTSIGSYAFSYCKSLTSVTIPDSVTSIGECAFSGCTGLTSVTIPDGVTSIGSYAFSYCKSLTSVTIPDSVTSIGEKAFYGCSSLTNITYQGSKSEWRIVEKGTDWDSNTGNYTIHCTNGDIAKS